MMAIEHEQVVEYLRSAKSFLNYWIGVNTLLLLVAVYLYKTNLLVTPVIFVGGVNLILMIARLSANRLKMIRIDERKGVVLIELDRFLFIRTIIEHQVQDVSSEFKIEARARGMKVKVFKIFCDGEILIEAVPGLSGWSESTLKQIKEKIEALRKRDIQNVP